MCKRLLTLMTLAAAVSALSCTAIARRVANNLGEREFSKEFDFYIKSASAYRKCLDTRQGSCDRDLDLGDLADTAPYEPTNPLVTAVQRRPGADDLGDAGDVLRASASAGVAAAALGHDVQKKLNALYNAMSAFSSASVLTSTA